MKKIIDKRKFFKEYSTGKINDIIIPDSKEIKEMQKEALKFIGDGDRTELKGFSVGDVIELKVDMELRYKQGIAKAGSVGVIHAFPVAVTGRIPYFILINFGFEKTTCWNVKEIKKIAYKEGVEKERLRIAIGQEIGAMDLSDEDILSLECKDPKVKKLIQKFRNTLSEKKIRLSNDEILCDFCRNYNPGMDMTNAGYYKACWFHPDLGKNFVEKVMDGRTDRCPKFEEI
jgi:hypothetical protein